MSWFTHICSLTHQDLRKRKSFAPRDTYGPESVELVKLFTHCDIPTAFVAESLADVSHSFGTSTEMDGTTYLWFHFLAKNFIAEVRENDSEVVPQKPSRVRQSSRAASASNSHVGLFKVAQELSQSNFEWTKIGVVLHVAKAGSSTPQMTLYCFGAPTTCRSRFIRLCQNADCQSMLQNPYMVLGIIIEEMYKLLDQTSWAVARSFGPIETV